MKIDKENSFKEALKQGINLFVGSGFSILAQDCNGKDLPLGNVLYQELETKFDKSAKGDLAKLSTILKKKYPVEFNDYLTTRFTVTTFNDLYININRLNISCIFTTNIDNLIPQIIAKDEKRFIHNMKKNGDTNDQLSIKYLPLHGNVEDSEDEYIFTTTEISTVFDNSPRIWSYLSSAIERHPTVFLGYSCNDTSTISAICSERHTNTSQHKDKWILLKEPSESDLDYYEALGFNIIEGDTEEFLREIPNIIPDSDISATGRRQIIELFKGNVIPKTAKGLAARAIIHFFRGMAPEWCDILSGNIQKTHHVDEIRNSIQNRTKATVVIGTPLCGKSTAVMQAMVDSTGFSSKLFFTDMTGTKADYLSKHLINQNVLIVIDNCADDISAFINLASVKGIKIVGMARTLDYGIVSHKLDADEFDIINVTDLSDDDFYNVYTSLPVNSRKASMKIRDESEEYKRDTIFEFVLNNIEGQSIEQRYKAILETCDPDHVEFLVLCAYMHYCRIPLSIEVAASFFSDRYEYSNMLSLSYELDELLKELDSYGTENMEYYNPRSSYLADVIIRMSPVNILKKIVSGVIDNVPQVQIPNYKTFKRRAFDHRLIVRAFLNWKEGKDFYEKAFRYDFENPYILQQMSLYLSNKKQYNEAFNAIDKAKILTRDSQFSIRNTHAIILFEANSESRDTNAIKYLDESMKILKKCYNDDKRKDYHAQVFGEQAIRYYRLTATINEKTDKAKEYLDTSRQWLNEVIISSPWNHECKKILKRIQTILEYPVTLQLPDLQDWKALHNFAVTPSQKKS